MDNGYMLSVYSYLEGMIMKTVLITLTLLAMGIPAFGWGFGPNGCLNNGYAAPTATCGPYYSNYGTFGGFNSFGPPVSSNTQYFPLGNMSTTTFSNGASANTQYFPLGNMSTTTYSGF